MPSSIFDALVRLIGQRVTITTESRRRRTGTLAAVIDNLAILSFNGARTAYIRISEITEVATPALEDGEDF